MARRACMILLVGFLAPAWAGCLGQGSPTESGATYEMEVRVLGIGETVMPLEGASVRLVFDDGSEKSAPTDAGGNATFVVSRGDSFRIEAAPPGWVEVASVPVRVPSEEVWVETHERAQTAGAYRACDAVGYCQEDDTAYLPGYAGTLTLHAVRPLAAPFHAMIASDVGMATPSESPIGVRHGWTEGFVPVEVPVADPMFWFGHVDRATLTVRWNNAETSRADYFPAIGCGRFPRAEGETGLLATRVVGQGEQSVSVVWEPSPDHRVEYPWWWATPCGELVAGVKARTASMPTDVDVEMSFELGPRTQIPRVVSYRP